MKYLVLGIRAAKKRLQAAFRDLDRLSAAQTQADFDDCLDAFLFRVSSARNVLDQIAHEEKMAKSGNKFSSRLGEWKTQAKKSDLVSYLSAVRDVRMHKYDEVWRIAPIGLIFGDEPKEPLRWPGAVDVDGTTITGQMFLELYRKARIVKMRTAQNREKAYCPPQAAPNGPALQLFDAFKFFANFLARGC